MSITPALHLGIDQSFTSSGLCLVNHDDVIIHHEMFATSKEMGDNFHRARLICARICKVVEDFNPTTITIEGLAFGIRGNATRDLGGLQYCIIMKLYEMGIKEVRIAPPKSLKLFATGSGKAKKLEMLEAMSEEDQQVPLSYKKTKGRFDIVDAFWLAKFGKMTLTNKDLAQ